MDPAIEQLEDLTAIIPERRTLVGFYVWAVLLILAAALEIGDALLTAGNFNTVYERPTDRMLVGCEIAGAAMVLLAGFGFILAKRLSWSAVLLLQVLAAILQILPIHATGAALADAIYRGGDTGGLTVLGHQISLTLEYGIIALCALSTAYLCLPRSRQNFAVRR